MLRQDLDKPPRQIRSPTSVRDTKDGRSNIRLMESRPRTPTNKTRYSIHSIVGEETRHHGRHQYHRYRKEKHVLKLQFVVAIIFCLLLLLSRTNPDLTPPLHHLQPFLVFLSHLITFHNRPQNLTITTTMLSKRNSWASTTSSNSNNRSRTSLSLKKLSPATWNVFRKEDDKRSQLQRVAQSQ